MIRGLYTSAAGMLAESARNDVAANNLANVNTTGYKKDAAVFKSFPEMLIQRMEKPDNPAQLKPEKVGWLGTGVIVDEVITIHTQGQLKETTNPLDMAISGDGYFVIQTPAGERYTRNGAFTLDSEGYLVTSEGNYVLGQRGRIRIGNNDIVVDKQGNISANGQVIDTLRIVSFNDPNRLVKQGDSLFAGGQPVAGFNGQIMQKALETSNVNPVQEMVDLITIMRAYEANQKMIQAHDQTLGQAINDVARFK
ncbi:flagellar basal-body rod protein FlgF [Thermincola potens]|uniref:Flagellar basal-body rod protein FlgF n=1 Tax=Thermincola potens (strain JR) TaxID=635013 RepID=D5XD38_THEPJ|nr:flagellar basal-body rod protein FlgF [Thermincola potens]ADG83714.1 flagellar basal-body rod protein FlgF [Thermincola potens JR]